MDWLTRKALGQPDDEQEFPVLDRDGRQIALVQPADRDSRTARVLRIAFTLIVGGRSTRRDVRDLRLVDNGGATLLAIHVRGGELRVYDAIGRDVGLVLNRSGPRESAAHFHEKIPQRKVFFRYGEPLAVATATAEDPPFEWAIESAAGTTIGRLSNEGNRRNVLERYGGMDDRLHTLLLAFACGLVDRVWIRRPRMGSGD
jgi:hypothetical protein